MVINTNTSALTGARLLAQSSTQLSKSLARLSSGSKINSPGDDVGGTAVSMKLESQISRLNAASDNISNAISFGQTQDGYLQKVSDALNRMSELAVMAQDVTKSTEDKDLYKKEFDSLGSYIKDLSGKNFNGVTLFSSATLNVTTDSYTGTFAMAGVQLGATYMAATVADFSTTAAAADTLKAVDAAITQLATDRATVGTNVSSLQMYNDQLGVLKNNLSAADSNIKDVDVAQESTNYARYNILVQAGTAMLAQANSMPQSVLKLIS